MPSIGMEYAYVEQQKFNKLLAFNIEGFMLVMVTFGDTVSSIKIHSLSENLISGLVNTEESIHTDTSENGIGPYESKTQSSPAAHEDTSLNAMEVLENKVSTCLLTQDTGMCRAYNRRWYYDAENGTCYEFTYGGCQGNKNNFETESNCYAACKGVSCSDAQKKRCQASESPCAYATCPTHPSAKCRVNLCSCEAVFQFSNGQIASCTLPSNRYNFIDISSDESDSIDNIDAHGVANTTDASQVTSTDIPTVTPSENDDFRLVAIWSTVATCFILVLAVAAIGFYKWRRAVNGYASFPKPKVSEDQDESKEKSEVQPSQDRIESDPEPPASPVDGSGV